MEDASFLAQVHIHYNFIDNFKWFKRKEKDKFTVNGGKGWPAWSILLSSINRESRQ